MQGSRLFLVFVLTLNLLISGLIMNADLVEMNTGFTIPTQGAVVLLKILVATAYLA